MANTARFPERCERATEPFTSEAFYDCMGRTTVTATQGADGNFAPALPAADDYAAIYTLPATSTTLFAMAGCDSRGNTALTVDANGNSVISIFDGASRRIEVDQLQRLTGLGGNPPAGGTSFLPGGRGLVRTQSVFDGNSRLTTLIDDRGDETGYAYDLLDRQVTMTFQDGSTRNYTYDSGSGDIGRRQLTAPAANRNASFGTARKRPEVLVPRGCPPGTRGVDGRPADIT